MNFFESEEYITFIAIADRLKEVVTANNLKMFDEWSSKAREVCVRVYGNVGYNEETNSYDWLDIIDIDRSVIYEPVIKEEDSGSFINNTVFYVSECGNHWKVRHVRGENKGRVIYYNPKEVKVCKEMSIEEIHKAHSRKLKGWEMVVSDSGVAGYRM